jgi:hypothetical protein
MSNLAFLLVALVLSVVGVGVLWVRNRAPSSPNSSIEEFHDKMRALAPEPEPQDIGQDRVVRRRRNREA